jgi:hypothetical protein
MTTVSGQHDNDAWNFVERGMKDFTGVTKLGVWYFYLRCEANSAIDGVFQPFLDSNLKGSTEDIGDDISSVGGSAKKKPKGEKYNEFLSIQQTMVAEAKLQHQTMIEQEEGRMKAQARLTEIRELERLETKRMNNFMQRLEVAKAMNDKDTMKKLMEEANNNNK